MARKNKDGKYIISAGEVGVYTVCPEAWRLQYVQKKTIAESENISEGRRLHTGWAKDYTDAINLSRMAKGALITALIAVVFVAISFIFK